MRVRIGIRVRVRVKVRVRRLLHIDDIMSYFICYRISGYMGGSLAFRRLTPYALRNARRFFCNLAHRSVWSISNRHF